jgi:hypothetical protein
MARSVRILSIGFFSLIFAVSLMLSGCTRYAKEEQLNSLDETKSAALAGEEQVAAKEKEKAELEAKLAEKQAELKKVQDEKVRIQELTKEE